MKVPSSLLHWLQEQSPSLIEAPPSSAKWQDFLQELGAFVGRLDHCHSMMDNLPYAVAWLDLKWNLLGANREYLRLFSAEISPLLNLRQEFEAVLNDPGSQLQHESAYPTLSDGQKDFKIDIRTSTENSCLILTAIDISRERDRARELEIARSKALGSARLAVLGEMAGGIAHEVNNPLAILQGISQQLIFKARQGDVEASFIKEKAEKMIATSNRIAKVVKGLRAFSKDTDEECFESFSLKDIVGDTLSLCQEKVKNRGVRLLLQEPLPEVQFECLPTQISQVLLNLINNACDAVQELEEKWIRLEFNQSALAVEIKVTDSGHGISSEIREKIFLPFFTTKEVGHGMGLGLSISSGIVGAHHGVIKVNPQSENTQFVILLPLNQKISKSMKVLRPTGT